ncbi:MAG: DUF4886 domain-containing protein [Dysgonamonadaceae bacterium]|jgi:hypothetical protein|nr:DUF4886 domain-containing protein [Dysgonamonadaceae bacterium]
MKKNLLYCFVLFILFFNAMLVRGQDTVRVLSIGNSFSQDAVEMYFHELGASDRVTLIVGNAWIGGCSLEKHWQLASNDSTRHTYRKIGADGKAVTLKNVALKTAITDEAWDYISLQQVSGNSGKYDTFFPYLTYLRDYVMSLATNPTVKPALHMTWAYAQDSGHRDFPKYGSDQLKMYRAIVDAYNRAAKTANIDVIIPSGTAIQNGRTSSIGDRFCRDGYHLDKKIGRYTAACTWYERLTGRSVVGNRFAPVGMSDSEVTIAQHAAHLANVHPNDLTSLAGY